MDETAREVADLALLRARGNQDLALMDLAALLLGCRGLAAMGDYPKTREYRAYADTPALAEKVVIEKADAAIAEQESRNHITQHKLDIMVEQWKRAVSEVSLESSRYQARVAELEKILNEALPMDHPGAEET